MTSANVSYALIDLCTELVLFFAGRPYLNFFADKFIGEYAIVTLFTRSDITYRKFANVNTSPWTWYARNTYKFAVDRGDRHACSVPEAATKYACVRFALSTPFAGAGFTRTPSLPRRYSPSKYHPIPTLSSHNRHCVRRCDIASFRSE